MQKILLIIKNKNEASSRFRVSAYLPYLKNDFIYEIFYSEYNNQKMPKFLRSIIKRGRFLKLLFQIKKYDIIFMQRPMSSDKSKSTTFEYIMSKINHNMIFDFDDALFIQNEVKIKSLIQLSNKVICGNDYLASFSKKYNKNTFIIPTTIDSSKFIPKKHSNQLLTIGWTGTSGNYVNFTKELLDSLKEISIKYENIKILFICDREPPKNFDFDYQFIKWNDKSEVEDLQQIDIGIMPLIDNPWTKGKCGFKLIQYASIGIPSIGSDVGVNHEIVLDNKSGYLICDESQWLEKLNNLIDNETLRSNMGILAREHIENNYSTFKNYTKLKGVLKISCQSDKILSRTDNE